MTDSRNGNDTFVPVGPVSGFPDGRGRKIEVKGNAVAVFNAGGRFYALADGCSHGGASLAVGTVKGGSVACPRHGAFFDLATGRVLTLPAVRNAESFETRVEGDELYVSAEGRAAEPLWVRGRRLDQKPDARDRAAVCADSCCTAGHACRGRKGLR